MANQPGAFEQLYNAELKRRLIDGQAEYDRLNKEHMTLLEWRQKLNYPRPVDTVEMDPVRIQRINDTMKQIELLNSVLEDGNG